MIRIFIITYLFFIKLAFANVESYPNGFADLVEKIRPSVVDINANYKVHTRVNRYYSFPNDPGMNDEVLELLERFGFTMPGIEGESDGNRQISSQGSGFIIEDSGVIITNYHVIATPSTPTRNLIDGSTLADEVKVILSDNSEHKATVIGYDIITDIALLKIDAEKNLPSANFGDSNHARVGDWVITIGNPFGLVGTVTSGIISARGRDIKYGNFDDFIQTDAAINFGNSGGPMFNIKGEVIGVNTAIYSPSGGNVGIAFATPSNIVKKVVEQIKQFGRVKRGWLGVLIQPIEDKLAEGLKYEDKAGIAITQVVPNSPAAKIGLKPLDIIVSFNGHKLENNPTKTLPKLVAESEIGKEYNLEVFRDGKLQNLKVVIEENTLSINKNAQLNNKEPSSISQDMESLLGIKLANLNKQIKMRFGIEANQTGVFVNKIINGSLAFQAGLKRNDVIVQVDKNEVNSINDFNSILKKIVIDDKKKTVIFLVIRNGENKLITINF